MPVSADIGIDAMVVRIVLAVALGGAIGIEREADGHEAGMRTHVLLAVGAALFGLISVGAFDAFAETRSATNFQVDVTRVASYVAAGIGFLGAGAIVKTGGGARGLTTASSIWATAAIGLACGLGFLAPALITTVAALGALVGLRPLARLARRFASTGARIDVLLVPEASPEDVLTILRRSLAGRLGEVAVAPRGAGGGAHVTATVSGHPRVARRLAGELVRRDDVDEVRLEEG